jgi:hypothetical protein
MNIFNIIIILLLLFSGSVFADILNSAIDKEINTSQHARNSQQKINQLSDQTIKMMNDYQKTMHKIDQIQQNNQILKTYIASQTIEIGQITEQQFQLTLLKQQIKPMIDKMYQALQSSITLDIPFDIESRKTKLTELSKILNSGEQSILAQFKALLSAYHQEWQYSYSSSTKQAIIDINGIKTTVNLLRVGRLAYVYQTLDKTKTAIWHSNNKSWVTLPSKFTMDIYHSIQNIKQSKITELVHLPVSNIQ